MIRLTSDHLQELQKRFREPATERVAPRLARQLIRLQEQIGRPMKDSSKSDFHEKPWLK